MKIYITGPTNGKKEDWAYKFYEAEKLIEEQGNIALNPLKFGVVSNCFNDDNIKKALIYAADAIYLIDCFDYDAFIAQDLRYAFDIGGKPIIFQSSISFFGMYNYSIIGRRYTELPDCNNCGAKRPCKYEPKLGRTVVINCPLWEDRKKPKDRSCQNCKYQLPTGCYKQVECYETIRDFNCFCTKWESKED